MYLISYDIDNDKVRNRIAKTLEDHGKRVQYSVFECDITFKQYCELYKKLADHMSGEVEGSIRFYFLCGSCIEKAVVLGCKTEDNEVRDNVLIV